MSQTKIKSKMIDWSTAAADQAAYRGALGFGNGPATEGLKNKIINGNFDIWQRATSHTAAGYGSADRWTIARTGTTQTMSRQAFTLGQTDVPGEPQYYCRVVTTSSAGASNYLLLAQRIEGVRTLAGKNARVVFYAKCDAARPITVTFRQNFGTGGSPSAVVNVTPQKFNLTTGWAKYDLTFAIPSISGKTLGSNANDYLQLNIWLDAGSSFNAETNSLGQQSGTFEFSRVAVVEGSETVDFEPRPLALEWLLCQRYYEEQTEAIDHYIASPGADYDGTMPVKLSVRKRAVPTITYTNTSTYFATSWAAVSITEERFLNYFRATTGGTCRYSFGWTASAEL